MKEYFLKIWTQYALSYEIKNLNTICTQLWNRVLMFNPISVQFQ